LNGRRRTDGAAELSVNAEKVSKKNERKKDHAQEILHLVVEGMRKDGKANTGELKRLNVASGGIMV